MADMSDVDKYVPMNADPSTDFRPDRGLVCPFCENELEVLTSGECHVCDRTIGQTRHAAWMLCRRSGRRIDRYSPQTGQFSEE